MAKPSAPAPSAGRDVDSGCDAEFVRLCVAYLKAVAAYDTYGGHLEPEDCPYWHAWTDADAALEGREPVSLTGILAMARIAQRHALQRDGSEDWSETYTGDWPARVTQALMRLAGGSAGA